MKGIFAKTTLLPILVLFFLSGCKDLWHPEGPRQETISENHGGDNSETSTMLLSPPRGVMALALSSNSIRVSWNTVSGATSYRVYSGQPGDPNPVFSVSAAGTTYDFTGLIPDSMYYFKVTAVNDSGEGNVSLVVSAQTHSLTIINDKSDDDSTIISTPGTGINTLITVTATTLSSNSIRLSWNPVSGATNYRIYEGPAGSDPIIWTHYSISTTSTSHVFMNLFPGSTYSYQVRAIGNNGQVTISSTASARTSSSVNISGSSQFNAIPLTHYTYGSFPAGLDAVWYTFTRHERGQISGLGREYSSSFTSDIVVDIYDSNLNLITIGDRLQSDIDLGWRTSISTTWSGIYYIRVRPKGGHNSNKGSFLLDPFYG